MVSLFNKKNFFFLLFLVSQTVLCRYSCRSFNPYSMKEFAIFLVENTKLIHSIDYPDMPSQKYVDSFNQLMETRVKSGYFDTVYIETMHVVTLKDDDVVIGIATFMIEQYENFQCIELDMFAIDEKYRGHGLGKEFLKNSIESALLRWPEAKVMKLKVHNDNAVAIHLYKSKGFIECWQDDKRPYKGFKKYL